MNINQLKDQYWTEIRECFVMMWIILLSGSSDQVQQQPALRHHRRHRLRRQGGGQQGRSASAGTVCVCVCVRDNRLIVCSAAPRRSNTRLLATCARGRHDEEKKRIHVKRLETCFCFQLQKRQKHTEKISESSSNITCCQWKVTNNKQRNHWSVSD